MYTEDAGHLQEPIWMIMLCSVAHGKNTLTICVSKCQLGKSEVHYLGHVIGGET